MACKNIKKVKLNKTTKFHRGKMRRRTKNSVPLCVPLLLIFFFISCQTLPKVPDVFLDNVSYLPLESGASAYIFANVQKARSILDLLPFEELNNKQARQMMDRTGFFAAALFPSKSGKRFQLAAWGSYPSFSVGFAFTFDKNWKKRRSVAGGSYWYSGANRLSISMTSNQAIIASSLTAMPFDPHLSSNQTGVEVPEGFNEFRNMQGGSADLSCWLENPGDMITRMLNESGLPIRFPVQDFFINLNSIAGGKYEAVIRFQFDNAAQARGMASILNLASNFGLADYNFFASLLMSNPVVQKDNSLDFFSNPLNERDILTIFNLFLAL